MSNPPPLLVLIKVEESTCSRGNSSTSIRRRRLLYSIDATLLASAFDVAASSLISFFNVFISFYDSSYVSFDNACAISIVGLMSHYLFDYGVQFGKQLEASLQDANAVAALVLEWKILPPQEKLILVVMFWLVPTITAFSVSFFLLPEHAVVLTAMVALLLLQALLLPISVVACSVMVFHNKIDALHAIAMIIGMAVLSLSASWGIRRFVYTRLGHG